MTLMTLEGKGHWVSIDPVNGIHTSLEIWKFCKKFSLAVNSTSLTIQENATGFCSLNGTIDNNHTGYTGSGFLNTDNVTGAGISWSVNIPVTGTYTLKWRYASTSSRPANLKVNGTTVASNIAFASSDAWTNWIETGNTSVTLTAGTKVIRLEAATPSGLGNIDNITITGISPMAVSCTGTQSSTAHADTGIQLQPDSKDKPTLVSREYYRIEGKKLKSIENLAGLFIVHDLMSNGTIIRSKIIISGN